jgi:hypothetical protein
MLQGKGAARQGRTSGPPVRRAPMMERALGRCAPVLCIAPAVDRACLKKKHTHWRKADSARGTHPPCARATALTVWACGDQVLANETECASACTALHDVHSCMHSPITHSAHAVQGCLRLMVCERLMLICSMPTGQNTQRSHMPWGGARGLAAAVMAVPVTPPGRGTTGPLMPGLHPPLLWPHRRTAPRAAHAPMEIHEFSIRTVHDG